MDWLVIVSSISGPLLILGAIFNFSVIKPLNTAIIGLNAAITAMREELHDETEKRQAIAERLARVETSAASAHHRISAVDERLQKHEHGGCKKYDK